uniref:Uncharacterized protein n=1 Tax=Avena sativa TaxID=4498 RepID=A0ACD5ZDM3_AVESA
MDLDMGHKSTMQLRHSVTWLRKSGVRGRLYAAKSRFAYSSEEEYGRPTDSQNEAVLTLKDVFSAMLSMKTLECTIVRQRAKIAWLSEGDANTSFFYQHASYRREKNVIHSLQVDGVVISDHASMAEASFDHFQGLLGTSLDQEYSLNLDYLGLPSEDLSELEALFSEEEIWGVMKDLLHGKAPAQMGSRWNSCRTAGPR